MDKAINLINQMLDHCPNCGSDNIANEGPPEDSGLEVTCHDCSRQWIDDERSEQSKIVLFLFTKGLRQESEKIYSMSAGEYKEFLKENFNISSLNN